VIISSGEEKLEFDMAFASVIVCAHNRLDETTIPCLENLKAVTRSPYELICVDDGSRDQGATIDFFCEVCDKAMRITENSGVAAARNLGFLAAEGSLIVFLDNDMYPPPGWLLILREEIVKDPRIGILAAIPSNEIGKLKRPASPDGLIDFSHVGGGSMAVTPRCHDAVGFFDERLINSGEDTDFCYRAIERGFRVVSTPRLIIRHEPGSTRRHMDKGQMRQAARYMRRKYSHRPDLPMPPLTPFSGLVL
jgi:GT2 family glycosyltransferase